MNIKTITYDDDGEPETLTFTMSLAEAAAIHALFGKLNGHAHKQLGDVDDVYDEISRVFNGHWDDGRPPTAPLLPTLDGWINEP